MSNMKDTIRNSMELCDGTYLVPVEPFYETAPKQLSQEKITMLRQAEMDYQMSLMRAIRALDAEVPQSISMPTSLNREYTFDAEADVMTSTAVFESDIIDNVDQAFIKAFNNNGGDDE